MGIRKSRKPLLHPGKRTDHPVMPGKIEMAVIFRHFVDGLFLVPARQFCQALAQGQAEGIDDVLVREGLLRGEMAQGLVECGQDQGRGVGQRPVKVE
jgi:hypothetical protein